MITNYKDLIALKGKTIFIVLSPKVEHTGEDIGNCKLYEWVVGDTHDNQWLDDAINDDRYLSLKDIGIIENDYNNHAAFRTKEEADSYIENRKATLRHDANIEESFDEHDFYVTNSRL